ncbi:MAG: hypothetical protein GX620_03985 [Chloroflexi bacterium]|nr:hypothetical protein [Chloroflexota bacterium]
MSKKVSQHILDAAAARADQGQVYCVVAFELAEELGVSPGVVGAAVDALDLRLARCQLGLFGYGDPKRIVVPASAVAPELEQAIRDGLILGRLPCAVAWSIATRFGMSRLDVAGAVETLGVRMGQCQLGAF